MDIPWGKEKGMSILKISPLYLREMPYAVMK
jgi:hypothetical protein